MTIKLFYKNTYIKEFNANICEIIEKDNTYHLQLNQTAFYPEGGGQPCDTGYIADIEVSHVYEDKGKIFHVVDSLTSKMENIKCLINWEKRFDHMQQHLGQHILSAAFQKLHDANTIGFHLSHNNVTIDIDKFLSLEDIIKVEYYANQIVFNDLSVEILYPREDELTNLPLRKQPTITDNIRVVKINDFDYSPCCGTHPNRSGEVGLIKIRKFEKYKSGIRIDFLCGNRALKDYKIKNDIINSLCSSLSVQYDEILNSTERINDNLNNLKKENKILKEQTIGFEGRNLLDNCETINDINVIRQVYRNRDFREIKQLSIFLVNTKKTIAILGLISGDKAQLILNRSEDLDNIIMKDVLKECMPLIDGKGGGSPSSAQGGGSNIDNLEAAVNLAYIQIEDICG